MAERRMFSKKIIDSDEFLDMPLETQSLYFHLAMRADDDGFVNSPRKILRAIGGAASDLELLIKRRFIIAFDSGIVVIRHWKVHNLIRHDRYKATMFLEERSKLRYDENGIYVYDDSASGNQMATGWQPSGNQMATQVSIGKDSIGKDSLDKGRVGEVSIGKERIDKDSLGKSSVGKVSLGEACITPTPTAYDERNNYEDFSSFTAYANADMGEELHIAPHECMENYERTPATRDMYNMKEFDSDNQGSDSTYADTECAYNTPEKASMYDERSIGNVAPKSHLGDGCIAEWGISNVAPKSPLGDGCIAERNNGNVAQNLPLAGDYGYDSDNGMVAPENSAVEAFSTAYDGEATDNWSIAPAAKIYRQDALKPVRGEYGRGIVCLTDSQLADLQDRLGEYNLNKYLDKLATFISDRGARIKSHYETILKWYAEDNTAPVDPALQTQKAQTAQRSYSPAPREPQKERYGDFDPKAAFEDALRRTYGDDYDRLFS